MKWTLFAFRTIFWPFDVQFAWFLTCVRESENYVSKITNSDQVLVATKERSDPATTGKCTHFLLLTFVLLLLLSLNYKFLISCSMIVYTVMWSRLHYQHVLASNVRLIIVFMILLQILSRCRDTLSCISCLHLVIVHACIQFKWHDYLCMW